VAERLLALDSSVAVPLIIENHPFHPALEKWAANKPQLYLSGHALAETYSIVTRLQEPFRVTPKQAQQVIDGSFAGTLTPQPDSYSRIHQLLAKVGISGGSTYDGLVALAALDNQATLVTRDMRALGIYDALGVKTEVIANVAE